MEMTSICKTYARVCLTTQDLGTLMTAVNDSRWDIQLQLENAEADD